MDLLNQLIKVRAEQGFGSYGGQFVGETLMEPLIELEQAFEQYLNNKKLQDEFYQILTGYVGRPTPLSYAKRLTQHFGGAKIYLKREDLNHTGAHKINNVVGQLLLAKALGKKRIIAETGAGQHGVATATMCANFGLECHVYMGAVDVHRQRTNVERMKMLGAKVIPVSNGSETLKDAINEALRDWASHPSDSYYLIGSALGPHPYPKMVKEFQSVIGLEARSQILQLEERLPDLAIACVGGGSNAIGLFSGFVDDPSVALLGVEAGGKSFEPGEHAARFETGKLGVFQGCKTLILQEDATKISETSSISAGLDYAAVGPEHVFLNSIKRAKYTSVKDEQALEAFYLLCKMEGIIPALESSHALAALEQQTKELGKDGLIIVNLSGRGDKDLPQILSGELNA